MTIQEFLDSEESDVPVKVSLKDGTTMVFRLDGTNSTELTGSVVGADVFLPFSDVSSIDILSEAEFAVQSKNHEMYWYR